MPLRLVDKRNLLVLLGAGLLGLLYYHHLATLNGADWFFYYDIWNLARGGVYPFLNYWMEYPPLFPLLIAGVARVLDQQVFIDQATFNTGYMILMSGIYVVNAALLADLVRIGHGVRAALRAVVTYAATPLIAWFTLGWFDGLALLFLLVGLRMLLSRRTAVAGVMVGLGILTKIFPGVLLIAAPAVIGWRATARLAAVVLGVVGLVLLPLAIARPDLLEATGVSLLTRPGWETIPAVLSGNYAWGVVAPLADRFTPETARGLTSSTSLLATVIQLLTGLIALSAVAYRTRRGNLSRGDCYALVALGVCALLLGSKGFSPQYLVWLVPLIILVWPDRIGSLYVLAFTAYGIGYYKFWFPDMLGYFTYDSVPIDDLARSAWLSASIRTVLLLIVMVHLVIRTCRGSDCALRSRPQRVSIGRFAWQLTSWN